MIKPLLLACILLNSTYIFAAPIAVIDSGTDLKHPQLIDKAWINPNEIADNDIDDDGAGYIDDVNGWNFAENNNEIIDYQYLGSFSSDVYEFFAVQYRLYTGRATNDDKEWQKERATAEFAEQLSTFGNFIHGTHVAGIAAKNSSKVRIMGIKLIPTEVSSHLFDFGYGITPMNLHLNSAIDRDTHQLILSTLDELAGREMKNLVRISRYVARQKMKIANCSFGTNMEIASKVSKSLLRQALKRKPTETEIQTYAQYFMNQLLLAGKAFFNAAPETLFVVAAGNDEKNNDEEPVSPANIKMDNTITVAATWDYLKLAKFSNYGKTTVDIAAPGLGIESAIPGDQTLVVSGTSQAAPFISNLVGRMLDANPKLSHQEVKTLLFGTVDKKDFLTDKVASGGIANVERALKAARLSVKMDLGPAIEQASQTVPDVRASRTRIQSDGYVLPMPSTFIFK